MKKITRTRCLIFSRVVGYLSATDFWNPAMKQMFMDRKFFKMPN